MITEAQRQQFEEQGYFVIDSLFSTQEMDDLQALIDPFVEQHEEQLRQVEKEGISRANEISFTTHLAQKDEGIKAFVSAPKWIEITNATLGPDTSLYWDQSVYKKPGTQQEFPWHQDTAYTVVEPLSYLTCWLALEDANLENGCIWVVPGSHKNGLVEHRRTDIGLQCYAGDKDAIPVELKKGGVAVFNSLLFHRSGPNTSQTIRKGYVIQYAISTTIAVETGKSVVQFPVSVGGQPVGAQQR